MQQAEGGTALSGCESVITDLRLLIQEVQSGLMVSEAAFASIGQAYAESGSIAILSDDVPSRRVIDGSAEGVSCKTAGRALHAPGCQESIEPRLPAAAMSTAD
jgi:hypothetical protein